MIRSGGRVALGFAMALSWACALGQGFNIDIDIFGGPENIGNGAPSSSFDAAAGQPGYWNRLSYGGLPQQVRDLQGESSGITMSVSSKLNLFHGAGFEFEGNTGDFARLLNDGTEVGSVVQGGDATYSFDGLALGPYHVYTYAVHPVGPVDTPILIPEAIENQTQVVTGPMPGNSFEYLVTHSIHLVDCSSSDSFQITIVQPPGMPHNMFVNGFQVVAVPEPSAATAIAVFVALLMVKRNIMKSEGEVANEIEQNR
ncbi:MAG: hypothetical protein ACR2HJ_11375 [Fimbriimonadales bacterium]